MERLSCAPYRSTRSARTGSFRAWTRHSVSRMALRSAPVCATLLASMVASAGPARAVTVDPDFFATYAFAVAAGIPPASLPAGSTLTPLARLAPPAYADGIGAPAGATRPSPRAISNAISTPALRLEPEIPLSTLTVAMLQLLTSHTHARTPTSTDPAEAFNVVAPANDPIASTVDGALVLPMQRSIFQGGTGPEDPREQLNIVTPRLDGSAIYGSDAATLAALREFSGGRLLSAPDGGLTIGPDGRPQAGDVRADENPVLLATHQLFHREHNRIAGSIVMACAAAGLPCSDEAVFQGARQLVVSSQQKILYEDILPQLLGRGVTGAGDLSALLPDPSLIGTAPGAIAEFTAAAGRLGHSQVPDTILLATPDGAERRVPLSGCFFDPGCLGNATIEEIIYGAAMQQAEAVDSFVVDSLRNAQLPGFGASFLIDLLATNIQRGRDHGLPDYMAMRAALGFPDIPIEGLLPADVLAAYAGSGDGVDLLAGLLSEFRPQFEHLGDTGAAIWALQFIELADDPDFYTAPGLSVFARDWAAASSLGGLIAANTGLSDAHIDRHGFAQAPAAIPLPPSLVLGLTALGLLGALGRVRRSRTNDGRARALPAQTGKAIPVAGPAGFSMAAGP